MSLFTILIFIAFAVGAFGFIDEETELNFSDEPLSPEDHFDQIGEWEGRIVGGSTARAGQFPHQVLIRGHSQAPNYFCGGSILTRSFVLTSAFCLEGQAPFRLRILVGALRRLNDGIKHSVRSIHRHPRYSMGGRNYDISILRTVNEILFNTNVRPVTLPQTNVPDAGNLRVIVSGYGQFRFPASPGNIYPEILQYKEALTLNRPACVNQHGSWGPFIHNTTICVRNEPGQGACFGDEGSPLITSHGVQVGIHSWAVYCARGIPDVYTNVWSHIEWIRTTIREELKKNLSD